jgi:hypothetical protein
MDRLLRWVRDIRQATFFDIQNVADYYFAHKAEDAWDTEKDFTIAPPFPFFATRYTLPRPWDRSSVGWKTCPCSGWSTPRRQPGSP